MDSRLSLVVTIFENMKSESKEMIDSWKNQSCKRK